MTIIFDYGVVKASAASIGNTSGLVRNYVQAVAEIANGYGAGMAGTDTPGQKFAANYDALAKDGFNLAATEVNALSKAADLLDATAANHKTADQQSSQPKLPPIIPPGWTPPAQNRSPMTAPTSPPSLGSKAPPNWWESIKDHVGGAVWPNGDPAKLRKVGVEWNLRGNSIEDLLLGFDRPTYGGGSNGPIGDVDAQVSPEIPDVVANLEKARDGLGELATAFRAAGDACTQYAQRIDDVQNKIANELIMLTATVAASEVTAIILVPVSLGASEAVSKAVDLSRLEAAGQRIAAMISDFVAACALSEMPMVSAAAAAVQSAERLAPLASANISMLAAEEAGLLTGETGSLDLLYPRPYLRVGTERAIQEATKKTADGKYYIVNSDTSVRVLVDKNGSYGSDILSLPKTADGKYFIDANGIKYPVQTGWDYGHVSGKEFWRLQQQAYDEHWTRQQWNDAMNNPRLYEIQDIPGNRSHRYEQPR